MLAGVRRLGAAVEHADLGLNGTERRLERQVEDGAGCERCAGTASQAAGRRVERDDLGVPGTGSQRPAHRFDPKADVFAARSVRHGAGHRDFDLRRGLGSRAPGEAHERAVAVADHRERLAVLKGHRGLQKDSRPVRGEMGDPSREPRPILPDAAYPRTHVAKGGDRLTHNDEFSVAFALHRSLCKPIRKSAGENGSLKSLGKGTQGWFCAFVRRRASHENSLRSPYVNLGFEALLHP